MTYKVQNNYLPIKVIVFVRWALTFDKCVFSLTFLVQYRPCLSVYLDTFE